MRKPKLSIDGKWKCPACHEEISGHKDDDGTIYLFPHYLPGSMLVMCDGGAKNYSAAKL